MTTLRKLLFFLSLITLAWSQPTLSVTGNPYQGSHPRSPSSRVQLFPSQVTALPFPSHDWRHLTLVAQHSHEKDRETVLPVGIDTLGPRTLSVKLAQNASLQRSIKVTPRDYGHQSISLSLSTLASYDDTQNKADDDAIIRALLADSRERLFRDDFIYPVDAPQSSGFGLKRTYNGWKKGWHKGLDLAGWEGETVVAPTDGVVLHIARGVVNGNTIILGHGDGVGTCYLHLSEITVRKGQKVRQGDPIGAVGGTGGFSPHLHWEVRVHGVPVHPQAFFALPESRRGD